MIGQTFIFVMVRVFFKVIKVRFAFCHSVASVYFGKQCRASVSSFSKLNWDAMKLTALKHEILFLHCLINISEIL